MDHLSPNRDIKGVGKRDVFGVFELKNRSACNLAQNHLQCRTVGTVNDSSSDEHVGLSAGRDAHIKRATAAAAPGPMFTVYTSFTRLNQSEVLAYSPRASLASVGVQL